MAAAPAEARGLAAALAAAEVALALAVAWVLVGSGAARHGSLSVEVEAGDLFILVAGLGSLGLMAFVLAFWQWRLRGRDRARLLVAGHASLVLAFCGLCWYDVAEATALARGGPAAGTTVRQVVELTAASSLSLAALLGGLIAFAAILWAARRALKQAAASGIVDREA